MPRHGLKEEELRRLAKEAADGLQTPAPLNQIAADTQYQSAFTAFHQAVSCAFPGNAKVLVDDKALAQFEAVVDAIASDKQRPLNEQMKTLEPQLKALTDIPAATITDAKKAELLRLEGAKKDLQTQIDVLEKERKTLKKSIDDAFEAAKQVEVSKQRGNRSIVLEKEEDKGNTKEYGVYLHGVARDQKIASLSVTVKDDGSVAISMDKFSPPSLLTLDSTFIHRAGETLSSELHKTIEKLRAKNPDPNKELTISLEIEPPSPGKPLAHARPYSVQVLNETVEKLENTYKGKSNPPRLKIECGTHLKAYLADPYIPLKERLHLVDGLKKRIEAFNKRHSGVQAHAILAAPPRHP